MCRLCGIKVPLDNLTSLDDNSKKIQLKLQTCFDITLQHDKNKMLAQNACDCCLIKLNDAIKFRDLIISVQSKLNVQAEHIDNNDFGNYEMVLKIERLDPEIIRASYRKSSRKRTSIEPFTIPIPSKKAQKAEKKWNYRNKGKKTPKERIRYSFKDLFKEELKGKFAMPPLEIDLNGADENSNGTNLKKIKTQLGGWLNYEWKCSECFEIFNNVLDLENHSKQVHKRRCVTNCQPCQNTYLSYTTFLNHISEKHEKLLKFCCIVCSEFRSTFLDLHRHYEKMHKDYSPNFLCLYCGYHTFTGVLLKDHIRDRHVVDTTNQFECDLCSKMFSKKQKLLSHMHNMHISKSHTCEICGLLYKFNAELISHKMSAHTTSLEFTCQEPGCSKSFGTKRKLRRHINLVHPAIVTLFTCETCGKVSKCKKSHQAHMKVHGNCFPYACQFCDRSFKHASGFNYHIRAHTGI